MSVYFTTVICWSSSRPSPIWRGLSAHTDRSSGTRARHFRTSVRTSAPPYLRTTKGGAEIQSVEKFSKVWK
ncbi:hypothetical protein E2C01_046007 [Portunus trituberculatus]|uniref:Uncharacterized protein n=1 Tax=Portunus trituberculatus TaxID=210409 RepID=A0A5B7G336_PORTR|nr:hypothetical protein [Portunus trituberculatus]